MSNLSLEGQCALITGASRGIGKAIAQKFAQAGAKVMVHYNQNQAAAEVLLADLPGSGHGLVQANLANPQAVQSMVATAAETLDGLDILVNNAGVFFHHPLLENNYEDWQKHWAATMAVNLSGPANACFCAVPHMLKRGGGRIINISSRGAYRGEPVAPAYGASKAGLNAMSQSLAQYLAPHNIFVTAIAPGWVETDMASDSLAEGVAAQSPLNRAARPDEIAQAALFLASPGCEFATGAVLDVNGASYLR